VFRRIRSKLNDLIQTPPGLANGAAPARPASSPSEHLPLSRSGAAGVERGLDASPTTLRSSEWPAPPAPPEPAPVIVYFEKDRNQRLLGRVEEVLRAKSVPFRALDVSGDPATLAFIIREARCEEDDLPIVFVAGTPVGGFNELVNWDISGRLELAVFGK
jgi:glutaredoxin